jgi:hypothetical protein
MDNSYITIIYCFLNICQVTGILYNTSHCCARPISRPPFVLNLIMENLYLVILCSFFHSCCLLLWVDASSCVGVAACARAAADMVVPFIIISAK